jgi:hypothetical protein
MSTITQLGCVPSNSLPAPQPSPADFIVFATHTFNSWALALRSRACGSAANDPADLAKLIWTRLWRG